MKTFISAEYTMANILIAMHKQKHQNSISIEDLNTVANNINNQALEQNIDAIFLISNDEITHAIFEYTDYFEYNINTKTVSIAKNKDTAALSSRFMGYMPFDILLFLTKASNEAVNSIN
jgi:hypothetical protein